MPVGAGKLRDGVAVPVEFQPFQTVEDGGDGGVVVAFAVGVLDAQQEFSAPPLGVQPVEQRGARAADMQIAGGRGRKAHDRRGGGHSLRRGLGHRTFLRSRNGLWIGVACS